jgi:chorismate dehydratase
VIKIAAVSYSNTFPFVYGIEKSENMDPFVLELLHPRGCAESFIKGNADIALLPVGALNLLPDYKIITDTCIGALQEVKSVLLLSNKMLKDIRSIALDNESATSVKLCKILASNFWNIKPEWKSLQANDYKGFSDTDACMVIGDKAFEISSHFSFHYDLATEWYKFTGLPFVFAIWVSRPPVSDVLIHEFSNALHYGVDHIPDVVKHFASQFKGNFDLQNYLTDCIDYHFDESKKESLERFKNLTSKLD